MMPDWLTRLFAITRKEFKQLRRDRLTFAMIVGLPLIQILLFGYAIELDVRHLEAGVADRSGTVAAQRIVQRAEASQVVDIVHWGRSAEDLEARIRRGEFKVGLVFPPDLERRLAEGDRPAGQLLIDGSDPTIERIVRQLARMPLHLRPADTRRPDGSLEARTFYNPEGRTELQIVPALIGVILHLTLVLFTAMAIVRERERGNLEMLIATPVSTPELMMGKLLPYILIGLIQTTIVLLAGLWLFDVPLRGETIDLYTAALAFIFAALALGLFISTLAATQMQAMQLTIFTFLPSVLLSGFMFPFEGMPKAAQWLGEIIPLTHFIRMVRGILLRGTELGALLPELGILLVFGLVFLAFSLLRFRKRLD